jgi:hypothetical protein
VDIGAATDTSGGYHVGWIDPGEWLKYSVTVASTGTYDIEIRVASREPGGMFHIEADGVDKTGLIAIPDTGGWLTWTTIRRTGISLNAGPQVLRVVFDSVGTRGAVGNINWIRVSSMSSVVSGVPLRGPYVQQVSSTSAIVAWTTRQPGAAEVRYSGPGVAPRTVAAVTRVFPATQTGFGFDFYQHEARLTGLTAASTYTYDLFMSGQDITNAQDSLTSAPATGTGTVRFIAFGDGGVGSTAQRQLAARMASDTFDLSVHAGDVAYGTPDLTGGPSYRQYDDWVFDIYLPWMRSRPFFPSIGNHDDEIANAQAYRDVFMLPTNGASTTYPDHAERFYSFDYGPIHFIALDTELAFQDPARRDAQVRWLQADLAATSQPWKVVYMHRPPYSAGTHHGSEIDVRNAFAPIFEQYNVQLVIASHDHDYERSVPWREFLPGGPGVVYVVSGGGGAALYPSGSAAWTAASASIHHYTRFTVNGCTLTGEAVASDGGVFDRFTATGC